MESGNFEATKLGNRENVGGWEIEKVQTLRTDKLGISRVEKV